ncbi:MAG TPA: [acyl-carrier-protein] S-malonyltransferase [Alphaproteobacteria bacterium]|nr:[acyl-carrier-protein] S-malonyltransferase [Alphaproteobacteria bacterium]HBF98891.1 [acyl-carrier-protein] S-malonyltransferase [Alphaproteobacteria bacterium]HCO90362.1 [acyl-carrier-protein] S-malonyltransferase [Alphaproteobacteria bacterium]
MARAFTFPGQGSQAVGMGQQLAEAMPAAREVFEEVNDALSQNLTRLMWEGPEDELTLTENAQPALMAVSVAVARVLERDGGLDLGEKVKFVAGHSLGEYSALTVAGAVGLSDTARLLKLRGQSMQKAVPVGEGAMAALLGADLTQAEAAAAAGAEAAGAVCQVANDNAPGQVVISGARAAVEAAIAAAKEMGVKRGTLLPVSAPFHCALMQPAADAMAEALATIDIQVPIPALIGNVTAGIVEDPEEIRSLLVAQVTGMVRWRESVEFMAANGIDTIVELGAGKVLTGMAKRINRDLTGVAVGTPDEIEAFLKTL